MTPVQFTVNGRPVSESVEPRMHLADFLRERLNLTATHLRCEQGACGTCTLLIDGQPARSCITYAVSCDGADITTLEGLDNDTIMAALRRAFSMDHALQCGYCTPGMLMTARDIIIRLPDADQARLRLELSGNLCRCTGYVGIVRAIGRVLDERRTGKLGDVSRKDAPLGPVGARPARAGTGRPAAVTAAPGAKSESLRVDSTLGLGDREPNLEIVQSFAVSRPADAVWAFFADIAQVVPCLPGASLTSPPGDDHVEGRMSVKIGPITANFAGHARIVRDEARRRGLILAAGKDQFGGSRAIGEVEYVLRSGEDGGTKVDLTIKALLLGPLAQFGRSGIVEELAARITNTFARNLEARLSGAPGSDEGESASAPLEAGSLLWQVIMGRLRALSAKIFGGRKP